VAACCASGALAGSSLRWTASAWGTSGALGAACDTIVDTGAAAAGGGLSSGWVSRAATSAIGGAAGSASASVSGVAATRGAAMRPFDPSAARYQHLRPAARSVR